MLSTIHAKDERPISHIHRIEFCGTKDSVKSKAN